MEISTDGYRFIVYFEDGDVIYDIEELLQIKTTTPLSIPSNKLLLLGPLSKKDYGGMIALCPWSLDDFEYNGLGSHNTLSDGITGDFGLTEQELKDKAEELKGRRQEYFKEWRAGQHGTEAHARRNAESSAYNKRRFEEDPNAVGGGEVP
ncbi:hypothetical protein KVT40_006929 [Elsinoe batatas]|uniref:Uncharacterized protein n=1 Tax=Elsinoe batatas TaxID=2601811 RepID=A0A8K0L3N1_9PEZI|nr:hypothetical protein KVT40_006929 [Elsinoe batatas]